MNRLYEDDGAATQLDDVSGDVVNDSGEDTQHTADDSQGNDEYFLTVDERTRYKTQDDAIKAYQSAGQRISELSAYEKELHAFGIRDPKLLNRALSDYAQRLQKERDAQAQSGNSNGSSQQNGVTRSDSNLSDKDKAALAWLKKMAPELGYVPKEELEAVKKEIAELKGFTSQANEERFNSLVDSGQKQLHELMKSAKLPVDDPKIGKRLAMMVENDLRGWIESDASGQRLQRFHAGGQTQAELIKEGFAEVAPVFGAFKTNANASYVQNKNQVANRNPKPLPQNGSPARRQAGAQQQQGRVKTDPMKGVHDKAWAAFQKQIHPDAE